MILTFFQTLKTFSKCKIDLIGKDRKAKNSSIWVVFLFWYWTNHISMSV